MTGVGMYDTTDGDEFKDGDWLDGDVNYVLHVPAPGVKEKLLKGHKAGGSLFEQFKKDVRRFDSDKQYAQGWSDGFRQCETEQEALQRQIRMSIEQQQLSEARKNNELQEQYHLENQVFKGINTESLKALEK
jgi:hypothetical protein